MIYLFINAISISVVGIQACKPSFTVFEASQHFDLFPCVFISEEIREMFESCGFRVSRLSYIHRDTVNKKEDICVPRIFTQGVFVKE